MLFSAMLTKYIKVFNNLDNKLQEDRTTRLVKTEKGKIVWCQREKLTFSSVSVRVRPRLRV